MEPKGGSGVKTFNCGSPFGPLITMLDGGEMKAYRVSVDTTNAIGDTTYGPGNGVIGKKDPYRPCVRGQVIVCTDDPRKIYDEFPRARNVEEIGICYAI